MLTTRDMTERLGISQQAYSSLEKNAAKNKVSVAKLQQIAAAMDCEVICYVRPKVRKTFLDAVWAKTLPEALQAIDFKLRTVHKSKRTRKMR